MRLLRSFVKQKAFWLLLAILALAIFFRFFDLAAVPPGLYPDVAINGNDALTALKTHDFKLFYPENNGREGLFINLIALSFWLFGTSVWAIKIVPAIFGVLTVLGLYLLTKGLFSYLGSRSSQTIALLAAFFISISFWHVNFSRLGFRAIAVPFFLVWSFYFLYQGLSLAKTHSSWTFACFPLAGLFFGLGFHTYISFRIAPLILLVPIVFSLVGYWPKLKHLWQTKLSFWQFIKESYFHDIWWLWDIFFLFLILAALPMAIYFFQHPADFLGRTGQVSIFASESPIKTLLTGAVKSLGMFNIWGDCNWRHNYACQPELLWPIGLLFFIGLVISLLKIFRPANYVREKMEMLEVHWLLLVWFSMMLLPEILTTEGLPHSLRSIGAIPPVFIWTGLGAWWLASRTRSWLIHKNSRAEKIGLITLFSIILLLLALTEFTRYFLDWGRRAETRNSFTQRLVDEAKYLTSLPASVKKFVLVNEGGVAVPYPNGLPMPSQTIIFFNRGTADIKYLVPDGSAAASQPIKTSDPMVFVPLRPDEQLFKDLAKIFPAGQLEKMNDFEIFKVNF